MVAPYSPYPSCGACGAIANAELQLLESLQVYILLLLFSNVTLYSLSLFLILNLISATLSQSLIVIMVSFSNLHYYGQIIIWANNNDSPFTILHPADPRGLGSRVEGRESRVKWRPALIQSLNLSRASIPGSLTQSLTDMSLRRTSSSVVINHSPLAGPTMHDEEHARARLRLRLRLRFRRNWCHGSRILFTRITM